jgi:flagellar motor switch protein FliM
MSDASNPEATAAVAPPPAEGAPEAPVAPVLQPHDFRQSSLLSPRQMRKLRGHETQFLIAMESRVALFLRSQFPLKLAGIEVMAFQKLTEAWAAPTHLVLFKAEPLRGVSVLEIPLNLSLTIVDRLMGGAGHVEPTAREVSEIEKALLDQIVQMILEEWCNNWAAIKPLKPTLLGCESSGRYLQTAPPHTNMLTVTIDAHLGECAGQIKLAIPYAALEPCLRQLCPEIETAATEASAPAAPAPARWNRCLDDVALELKAEWQGMELSARDILHLKVGDVLEVSPQLAQQVCLRLGDQSKFNGRLGTVAGHWAVELTQAIKT